MFFLCIKIFFARIIDVSLGTIRTLYIVKGSKIVASLIAFIEVMIWFFAAREALNTDLPSLYIAASYSLGYATGTFIGTTINDLFIKGVVNIEVISDKITKEDIDHIKKNNFGVTVIKSMDDKYILFIITDKKRSKECIKLIKSIDYKSFIIVNNSNSTYNGYIKK